MIGLVERVELLHAAFAEAGIPHAFGGALALAFCTAEPRATADIDLNVFMPPERTAEVFAALPKGVSHGEPDAAEVMERGQVRLRWDDTPVDLFFAYHTFHDEAGSRARMVPFGKDRIPVLECGDLVVFKAIFGRPQDWVDIENMIGSGGVGVQIPLERLEALLGRDDVSYRRLASIGKVSPAGVDPYRRAFGSPADRDN